MKKHPNQVKNDQLGQNYSTASYTLVKDLLFSLIIETGRDLCFRCGEPVSRADFSIDHIEPWLHTASPISLFFDIGNIAYSHLSCNTAAARKSLKTEEEKEATRKAEVSRNTIKKRQTYNKETRRAKYLRTGK